MDKPELFTKLDDPFIILPCPVCGSEAELWERYNPNIDQAHKAVMCNHGDRLGPSEEGCPMYMPPEWCYQARKIEAVTIWNDFAREAEKLRRGRNWKRAKVLRKSK